MARRLFSRFVRSYTTLDLRTAEETRLARCTKYERKYKTAGKKAVFA
ncbi:hypothetical protein [Stenotrophomonas phage BUCT598]|uniref:Uncharacterized protein n=1 Tax=Stenotrophomonas phage BUCT598 TaxID=2834253 RepID=A0A8F2JCW5_9CAUD|nr:hypothetical protein [Stenotrophomonas phage BUCT598]